MGGLHNVQSFNFASATTVAGFEGHYAWKTDGTLWRLTTNTSLPVASSGSYVQVPNVLVQP